MLGQEKPGKQEDTDLKHVVWINLDLFHLAKKRFLINKYSGWKMGGVQKKSPAKNHNVPKKWLCSQPEETGEEEVE